MCVVCAARVLAQTGGILFVSLALSISQARDHSIGLSSYQACSMLNADQLLEGRKELWGVFGGWEEGSRSFLHDFF